jgi:hypothetical protein
VSLHNSRLYVSLYGSRVSLYGSRVSLFGSSVSLHGSSVSLYGSRLSFHGYRVILEALDEPLIVIIARIAFGFRGYLRNLPFVKQ